MSDKMRELFEKWAKSECLDTDSVDGFYSDNDTHLAWGSWQAAQSAAVPVASNADRDIAVMRASVIAYKEGRNGIERHPGNTAHENAAWEWGRKDGGWS